VLFAPAGDGQRRRRGGDGLRLVCAVLAVACCVLVIRFNSRIDRAIVAVLNPPPRSITWLVTVVYQAGSHRSPWLRCFILGLADGRRGGL